MLRFFFPAPSFASCTPQCGKKPSPSSRTSSPGHRNRNMLLKTTLTLFDLLTWEMVIFTSTEKLPDFVPHHVQQSLSFKNRFVGLFLLLGGKKGSSNSNKRRACNMPNSPSYEKQFFLCLPTPFSCPRSVLSEILAHHTFASSCFDVSSFIDSRQSTPTKRFAFIDAVISSIAHVTFCIQHEDLLDQNPDVFVCHDIVELTRPSFFGPTK